jgi:hypothetical protein
LNVIFYSIEMRQLSPFVLFRYHSLKTISLKMSETRSGTIYSKVGKTNVGPVGKTNVGPVGKTNVGPVTISIPKTPTPISRGNIVRPAFFEPAPTRTTRPNRTQLSPEVLRDCCDESDNDSTSSYDSDDVAAEEDQQQYYMTHIQPKYEVNIDFDEASKAWRENKRRAGESWVYKKEKSERKKYEPKKTVHQESSVASRLVRRSARTAAKR